MKNPFRKSTKVEVGCRDFHLRCRHVKSDREAMAITGVFVILLIVTLEKCDKAREAIVSIATRQPSLPSNIEQIEEAPSEEIPPADDTAEDESAESASPPSP